MNERKTRIWLKGAYVILAITTLTAISWLRSRAATRLGLTSCWNMRQNPVAALVGQNLLFVPINELTLLWLLNAKPSPTKHESSTKTKYAEYAVDGVLLYASFLAKEFDVLAIAVSGQDESSFRLPISYIFTEQRSR